MCEKHVPAQNHGPLEPQRRSLSHRYLYLQHLDAERAKSPARFCAFCSVPSRPLGCEIPRPTARVVNTGTLLNGIVRPSVRTTSVTTVLITQLGATLEKRAH